MAPQAPVACVLVALLATAAHAEDRKYTLADLKTLVADRAYQEAFTHLGDVAPAQRTGEWLDLAATATNGILGALPTDDGSTLAVIDAVEREYPQLLKAAKYVKVRAELGVKGLAGCYERIGIDECSNAGKRFAAATTDRDVIFEVAKVTAQYRAAEAVSLFKQVLDPKRCGDEQLRRAVLAGLDRKPGSPVAIDARAVMKSCWSELQDAIVKAFDEASKNSDLHKNTCDVLKDKRLLSSLQTKRCK